MKNIIVVLSGLLIGYLEATAEPPTESGPQKTKPIYIAYELPYYHRFIDSFKTRVAYSKSTEENNLEEEFFSVLKSAYFSNTSFLEKIQEWVSVTRCDNLTRNKILGWLNIFKSEREQRLADYTSVIIDLLNGYIRVNIDEAASNATILSFRELLEAAKDNLDLKDIEKIVQKVFFPKKSTEEKEDEKADISELDDIDSTTNECFQLFLTCLESYKLSTPSRSRTGSFF